MREPVRLYGRDAAVTLVGEFLERPLTGEGVPGSRPVPVLTFVGDRGTGKSALLTEIARQVDQQAPVARINCRTTPLTTPRQVLAGLAFELNRRSGRYGTLPFPRLVVGHLVIAQRLDGLDRATARSQVTQVLEAHRNIDALRQFLANAAPDVLGAAGVPGAQAGRYLPEILLRGLVSGRLGRRVVFGEGQDWYGHQDLGERADSIESLIDLNLNARSSDAAVRKQADEVLWAAFLADLRHAFGTGRHHDEWSWNCAVLLDDVDTPAGLALLEGLVTARRLQSTHPGRDPDPLTVVATSQAPLSSGEGEPPVAEHASYADYLRRVAGIEHVEPHAPGRWWYPVRLRDLDADEVLAMVKALELRGVPYAPVAAAVHRFTGGHPGTTGLLLDAISDRRGDAGDLTAVMRGPAPSVVGPARGTVEQALLDSLVHGLPTPVLDDLVTCSAARDVDQASRLQAGGLLCAPPGQRPEVFAARWWSDDGGARPLRMRPVLRRLLLMRLAARPDGAQASWGETHARLRRDCREAGDEVGEMYHALALGDVEVAARWLARSLPTADVTGWLGRLGAVTEAPSRVDAPGDPANQVTVLAECLAADEAPLPPLARLVAARWIAAHPLLSGDQKVLHLELAAAYDAVALSWSAGRSVLHLEAHKHRSAADGLPY